MTLEIAASQPPAITASALPLLIHSLAIPIDTEPEAQAWLTVRHGPFAPVSMEMKLATLLGSIPTMK